jgi:hypothetical protein
MVPCPKCGVPLEFRTDTGTHSFNVTYAFNDAPEDVMKGINYFAPYGCGENGCRVKFWVKKFDDKYRPMEWTPLCELEQERWGGV